MSSTLLFVSSYQFVDKIFKAARVPFFIIYGLVLTVDIYFIKGLLFVSTANARFAYSSFSAFLCSFWSNQSVSNRNYRNSWTMSDFSSSCIAFTGSSSYLSFFMAIRRIFYSSVLALQQPEHITWYQVNSHFFAG